MCMPEHGNHPLAAKYTRPSLYDVMAAVSNAVSSYVQHQPVRLFLVFVGEFRGAREAAGSNYRLEGRQYRGYRRQTSASGALRGRRPTYQRVRAALATFRGRRDFGLYVRPAGVKNCHRFCLGWGRVTAYPCTGYGKCVHIVYLSSSRHQIDARC